LIPYANAASAFETPTSTELVNQSNGTVGFNTGLGPQRARSVEAGVRGEVGGGAGGRALGYSLALYTSSVRDALVQARELDGRAFFENAGRLRHQGLEGGLTAAPASWAQLRLAYTFSDSRFTEYRIRNGATVDTLDGKRVAGIPRHVLRAGGGLFLGPAFVELEQQVTSALFADDRNTIPVEGWKAGVT